MPSSSVPFLIITLPILIVVPILWSVVISFSRVRLFGSFCVPFVVSIEIFRRVRLNLVADGIAYTSRVRFGYALIIK